MFFVYQKSQQYQIELQHIQQRNSGNFNVDENELYMRE